MRTLRLTLMAMTFAFSSVVGFGWAPHPVQAADPAFSMHYIVTDDEFVDYAGWSVNRIQDFLNAQAGVLKAYVATDGRLAAQVVFDAAQVSHISPKVLLATIQKESSMLSRTSFNTSGYSGSQQYYLDWITFYGWCDSCSTGSDKGFINQVNATAAAFRRYLNLIAQRGYSISGWGPTITKSISCIPSDYNNGRQLCTPGTTVPITPGNVATSALYTYTPHPGGNYAFWSLWVGYGFNTHRLYPDGTLLKATGGSTIYLIQNGTKRKFTKLSVFYSRYSSSKIISVPADHLLQYDNGRDISFANYSLLAAPTGGIYLLVDDTKRPIKSRAAFQAAGFSKDEVVKVKWSDLDQFPDGEPITTDNIYPSGRLLQSKKNGGIYFVKDGVKHPVYSKYIYRDQFGAQKPSKVSAAKLDTYQTGLPVGFRDGDLVQAKGDPAIYVISNGYRLPIAGPTAFNAYRFNFANVLKVDNNSLWVHPLGPTLDIDTESIHTASH